MAEEAEAAPAEGSGGASAQKGQKPILFIILAVVNMLVVAGVGGMLYMSKKAQEHRPGVDDVIQGEHAQQQKESLADDFIGELIPLETFLVNLAGSRGRKLAKINMEFEVKGDDVQDEIDKLKPKIRDMIIIILSSKSYAEVSTTKGKDHLRTEIRDQVNLFLTKGQINQVYFTEFIYN